MGLGGGLAATTIARSRTFANSSSLATIGFTKSFLGSLKAKPFRIGALANDDSRQSPNLAARHGSCSRPAVDGESSGFRSSYQSIRQAAHADVLLVRSQWCTP